MPKHDIPEALTEERAIARVMVMKYAPVGMRNHDE